MSFIWTITYYPVNQYGIRYTRKPRTGHVRGRTADRAKANAKRKWGAEIEILEVQ